MRLHKPLEHEYSILQQLANNFTASSKTPITKDKIREWFINSIDRNSFYFTGLIILTHKFGRIKSRDYRIDWTWMKRRAASHFHILLMSTTLSRLFCSKQKISNNNWGGK